MLTMLAGWAWACPAPTTTSDVQRQVEAALFRFTELDQPGFAVHRNRAIESVSCLGEIVHAPHAASFLRLEGVAAFAGKNNDFAVRAFASAFSVQPNHQLPAALAPPGGPLHTVYLDARSAPASSWMLPAGGGMRFVNGIQTDQVPNGLAVVQLADPTGRVLWTGILTGAQDLPADFGTRVGVAPVPLAPVPLPVPAPVTPAPAPFVPIPTPAAAPAPTVQLDEPTQRKGSARIPVLVAAVVVGAVAGGLYTGSILSRGRYQAAPTASRRKTTNTLWYAAVGTGGVALTVGVVGIALPAGRKAKRPEKGKDGGDEFDDEGLY